MIDSNMQSAVLGRTGLYVKRLGYGAAHRKPQSNENAKLIHQTALDLGINFIDTADDYGNSEELIGEFLSHRRSEYFLDISPKYWTPLINKKVISNVKLTSINC